MALHTVGLQTHIWNNNLKSIILLSLFPFILMLLFWAVILVLISQDSRNVDIYYLMSASLDILLRYIQIPFIIAIIWVVIAYLFHSKIIEKASGERLVNRKEEPEIYNILENLCISRGLVMPKLSIIESPVLNAYASGISKKSYRITLTRGIIDKLNKKELESVIAHELTHIMNNDVRLLIISVIFVGIIGFVGHVMFRNIVYRSRVRSRGDGKSQAVAVIVALLVVALGYLFAIIIRFAISKKREYLADAGSVELTKNPDAMISALQKISGHSKLEEMPEEINQMCIDNPPSKIFSIFSTHPTIEKRIAAIRAIS